jgi:hypothetical protein
VGTTPCSKNWDNRKFCVFIVFNTVYSQYTKTVAFTGRQTSTMGDSSVKSVEENITSFIATVFGY